MAAIMPFCKIQIQNINGFFYLIKECFNCLVHGRQGGGAPQLGYLRQVVLQLAKLDAEDERRALADEPDNLARTSIKKRQI